jgi:hypothetical protein
MEHMEMKHLIKVTALASALFIGQAHAADNGINPYSDCGIGAAIFQDMNTAAAISNVIWDLGSTAITSATASPETCSGGAVQTAEFIHSNYDVLAEETARGNGEHLQATLAMAGCSAEDQSAATQTIRSEISNSVFAAGYETKTQIEKSSDFYNALQKTASQACGGSLI